MDPALVLLLLVLLSPILIRFARTVFVSSVTVDDLLQRPDLAWPRGVQEEEPVAWRLDRLTTAGHATSQLEDTPASPRRWPSATRRGPITSRQAAARHAGR